MKYIATVELSMSKFILAALIMYATQSISAEKCREGINLRVFNMIDLNFNNLDLFIFLENNSDDFIKLGGTMIPQHHWLKLWLTKDGKKIRFTGESPKLGKRLPIVSLRPNHFFGRRLNLKKYFKIVEKGNYKLVIKYGIPPTPGRELSVGICEITHHFIL